ncbi:MAG: hypothetical protein HETSPECPRED_008271 [Heterodermia speciosa]|uniref:Uncharacterized protein n=1 Tax=Heterodermia speciosa TaxID=116794 RepID=A0A8H3G2S8_9LECA|nr:MAG: hypothetical protein HETSPECPRED_008271 [Heterodermia speciosa]
MALPSFVPVRRKQFDAARSTESSPQNNTPPYGISPSKSTIKRATRTRLTFALLTSLCFLIALTFVILVEFGNISAHKPVVGSIWFMKLDLSNIIPASVPNASLINSIARTLGLHDFYQVGLWNFCEGYGDKVSECSKPRKLYWFNPVEIILNELLSGATIALPNEILTALGLVRHASHWMFALFLISAPLSFVCMLLTPLSVFSRWATLPIAVLSFLCALVTNAACILATALFVIFKNVIVSRGTDINIGAEIGTRMFVFMWIAAGSSLFGWLVQMGMCCCCASRRDVTIGRKVGTRSAYADGETPVHDRLVEEKKQHQGRRRWRMKKA